MRTGTEIPETATGIPLIRLYGLSDGLAAVERSHTGPPPTWTIAGSSRCTGR
jgi:hypothetical protein